MFSFSSSAKNTAINDKEKKDEIRRLMETYGNDVLRTSYMYLKDRHRAEDAFQEVFIKVYDKYESFRGESSEKTWLIRVTINVCKDMLRTPWLKRVVVTDEIAPRSGFTDIEQRIIKKDERKALYEEVLALPPEFKEAVLLFYYNDLSTAEISQMLNIAEGTVRSRLHRARELLKTKLKGRIDSFG